MKKSMIILACIFSVLTIASFVVYYAFDLSIFLSLGITFLTFSYHFIMRLVIGYFYQFAMKNHADYHKKWYHVHSRINYILF